jgi:hypothetical protein
MKLPDLRSFRRQFLQGVTLPEVMIATALGTLVFAALSYMTMYGARSSSTVVNYTDLDAKSRYALDVISRELRQATQVLNYQTSSTNSSLTLTNAEQATAITLTWDGNARTVTLDRTGQPTLTNLTECDSWDMKFYQRTPWVSSTNVTFYPATNSAGNLDPSLCKLIALSWKCSRTFLGNKLNTESVQAAQIVLRNKQ